MKRIEVSTKIGSLSVTYQKQKKMLVCLNGAGLIPSYENFSLILEKLPPTIGYLTIDFPNTGRSSIQNLAGKNLDNLVDAVYEILKKLNISDYVLCVHSLSGILACKLMNKDFNCQALVAIEPTTKKVMFADFSKNPYPLFYHVPGIFTSWINLILQGYYFFKKITNYLIKLFRMVIHRLVFTI